MQRSGSKDAARSEALTQKSYAVGTGIDLVVDLPLGAIDPQFVEEMIGDIRAAYQRALDRSWERFARLTGRKSRAA